MREQPNHSLKLDDARAMTPPVNPVEAMRRQLAVSVFGAVKESDIEQMVTKLKDMAISGDHKAMKMYFELIGVMGKQAQAPPPPQSSNTQIAEALRDLVDEIRVTRAKSNDPRMVRELAALNGDNDHDE
jgi:hypothetical protein